MSFRDPNPMSPPGINSDPVSFTIKSKIMLTTTILILFIAILMVSLHLCSRWYLLRSSRFNRTAAALTFFANPSSTAVVTTSGGLNPSVIKSLPIFTFSAATAQKNAIECAVCLSAFVDNESGRVLPNCKHTFHVHCIDMWFHSHSSCPLCRSLIEPFAGGVKSTTDEVAISISDLVSSDMNRHEGTETSGNPDPEDSRRKPAAIEIPRRNHGEMENDLTPSQTLRSPMSRVISFTRNLSRDRRSASSSSPVCSMPVRALDIELGGEETR